MKKKIMLLFGLILTIVIIISVVLGFLYFPRSIKSFMGISYEEIEHVYVESGYDTVKIFSLNEDDKGAFYDKLTKIRVMPTYSHMKAVATAQFIIKTEEETYIFSNFYYKTSNSSRKEFNLLDKKEFESLFSLFPNLDLNEYWSLN